MLPQTVISFVNHRITKNENNQNLQVTNKLNATARPIAYCTNKYATNGAAMNHCRDTLWACANRGKYKSQNPGLGETQMGSETITITILPAT
jgi:hypothetical protein